MNTTTLETSKALKAAGFPQETAGWGYDIDGLTGAGGFDFAAPDAQEIADQLPGSTSIYINEDGLMPKYSAQYMKVDHTDDRGDICPDGLEEFNGEGDTMAEALANLWLAVNKENQQ